MIQFDNVTFAYEKGRPVLSDVSFAIEKGETVGLIGANGAGKSTVMKLLLGLAGPGAGNKGVSGTAEGKILVDGDEVSPRNLPQIRRKLGFVLQNSDNQMFMPTVWEDMLFGLLNYGMTQQEAEQRAQQVLKELGQEKLKGLYNHKISGGEKRMAAVATVLAMNPEVLLMDEPTNFLDQFQVAWLENYLNSYPKAFLVVSHDEAFLEKIAQVVFCLENGVITRYKGTFEEYLLQHELDKEQYKKNYEAQQRYIKKEEQFIAAHIVRATSAKAAKSHRARLAHLDVMDAPSKDEGNVHFNFPFTKDVGQKPLEVNELVIGYDKPLLSPISFLLKKGEKIAILGQNGVGKSTFIKTILGQIPSLGGSYKWLDGIELNYYGQDEKIDLEMSPFDYIHNIYPNLTNTEVRTLLGAVGVKKELALRKMKELSGGEMTKARLAVMTRKKSNFLVFDEPTNHLDQKAKDALFEAIENYPGAVIIVSHEKDFYDGLVDYELKF